MIRNSQSPRALQIWHNPAEMALGQARPIDWERTSDYFAAGKFNIQLSAAAAIGADSLTVDALIRPLRAGEKIQFPDVPTVLVTVSGAHNAGDVVLNVTALPDALPDNALLDFGGDEFARVNGAHAAGDTTVAVDAIPVALEGGETATYQGGEHNVEVAEDVAAGETAVPIGNLQYALADDTVGIVQRAGNDPSSKFIPAGTVMAEDATTGLRFPRRDADDEEAVGFLVSDAGNSRQHLATDARTGYGIVIGNTPIWENLCPDADPTTGLLPTAYKTELKANTLGFTYLEWADSRLS